MALCKLPINDQNVTQKLLVIIAIKYLVSHIKPAKSFRFCSHTTRRKELEPILQFGQVKSDNVGTKIYGQALVGLQRSHSKLP